MRTEARLSTQGIMATDAFNRFLSDVQQAGDKTLEEGVKDMAATAKRLAPNRSGELRRGIHPVRINSREWRVVSTAEHTMPIETGYRQHEITGKFRPFTSTKAFHGKWWWNSPWFGPRGRGLPYENWSPGVGSTITSPARGARPFLRPAFEMHFSTIRQEMSRRYPG